MTDFYNSLKIQLLRTGLLFVILMMLLLPFAQQQLGLVNSAPLKGYIVNPEDAVLTADSWLSGDYAEKKGRYLNATFGFRNLGIRIHNQLKFSLFNKTQAQSVVVGKENYLYEADYIITYTGGDFLGEDSIRRIAERIKYVSDCLDKLNKQLIVVIAPGKASYYPEYIPDKFLPVKGTSNYIAFSKAIQAKGIHHIDFSKWFRDHKSSSAYPLYPKYANHWSTYGAALAADSIIKKIEFLRGADLPNLVYDAVDIGEAKEADKDIAEGLNLLIPLKSYTLAYPRLRTEPDSGKTKPAVAMISDSFYWIMFDFGIWRSFHNDHFWYYNKLVYPQSFEHELLTQNQNLAGEIARHDVFIVMGTDASLKNMGWGFFESLEKHFRQQK